MTDTQTAPIRWPVWDPLVRLCHWGIAAAVLLNGLLVDAESLLHVRLGYAAFALLALRLLWGFIGPQEARFSSFPPSLSAVQHHIGDIAAGHVEPSRSHNPLGALMAYALWAMLLTVCATGLMLDPEPFPAARADTRAESIVARSHADEADEREGGSERSAAEEVVEEIHEIAANILLVLAAAHVAGVAFETRRTRRDVLGPMLTGRAGDRA